MSIEGEVRPGVRDLRIVLDEAGKVILERRTNTLVVDGVRVSLEGLVACANPSPGIFYSAIRKGDEMRVAAFDRDGLRAEFIAQNKIERGFAYSYAIGFLEGLYLPAGPEEEDWRELATAGFPAEVMEEKDRAVAYLESRGLLIRHTLHPEWVTFLDEDAPAEVTHG